MRPRTRIDAETLKKITGHATVRMVEHYNNADKAEAANALREQMNHGVTKPQPTLLAAERPQEPSLGRIARETVRETKPISDKPGFPAQRIVLAKLNNLLAEPITADSLRKQFGYSSVTIIAALKELELQGIIRRESLPNSRKQSITFTTTGHALWNKISPLLNNSCDA